MSSSTSISKLIALALGAVGSILLLLVAVELIFRALPIAQAVPRADPATSVASARLAAYRDYTWSLGWDLRHVVHGRTNGMGFPSPHEYTADRDAVALFGDSYAEAVMLDYRESLAGQLDAHFAERFNIFNFGLSGASLPHYLGMAREMGSHFRFGAAVVLINDFDYVEGFGNQPGLYRWNEDREQLVSLVPSVEPGMVARLVRQVALLRYLRFNLKFDPSKLFSARLPAECVPQQLSDTDRERVTRYVDALPQALALAPQKIVMVFNTGIAGIYQRVDGSRKEQMHGDCPSIDKLALAELKRVAALRGIKVVDVAPLLEEHYRKNRRPLDFMPADGHWNGTAINVVADEVAHRLAPDLNVHIAGIASP